MTSQNRDHAEPSQNADDAELVDLNVEDGDDVVGGLARLVPIDSDETTLNRTTSTSRTFSVLRNFSVESPERSFGDVTINDV